MARVYAIASAKGGVGKTTTTANLGATLAGTGADVVVIDGDIGMANLGAALGVRPDGATLHDVLSDKSEPVAAGYEGPTGLTVVPGDTSLDAFAAADPQRLQAVIEAFADADYILIDVGAGVSHETSVPLSVADAVVLVSTPDRDALIDTEKTRQLTERLGSVVAGAVLTRTDEATPIKEIISGTLTADVLATIPDDEAVRESIAVGEPLVSYAPHSDAAAAYRQLATELTGIDSVSPEQSTTDVDAETQTALEESDEQLSESLSDNAVTIGTDAGMTGEAAADGPTRRTDNDSDDEHNVVNPFAASEEPNRSPDGHSEVNNPDESESKWAEAATGTMDESDSVDDIQPTTSGTTSVEETPSEPSVESDPDSSDAEDADTDGDSVPRDAIPFGGDPADDDDQTADQGSVDDESTQTTVLGSALEAEADETAPGTDDVTVDPGNESSKEAADDTNEDEDDGDEVVIPDAEETAAATAGESTDDATETGDSEDDEDQEEKRGFFSRLFGG